MSAADRLYARALEGDVLFARGEDGAQRPLPLTRWLGPAGAADESALRRASAPVLDVGCGPGRHVLSLARRGVLALGVDVAPAAIRHARLRGAPAVSGSVFADIPGTGTWGSALLLDGNIGIGGRPDALLRRLRVLLRPDGTVVCELDRPCSRTAAELVRVEAADGARSEWFPWARVCADDVASVACRAGYGVAEVWQHSDRHFALLRARLHR